MELHTGLEIDGEATIVDEHPGGWAITDEVVRLRQWGSDTIHRLPEGGAVLGSSDRCGIQVVDPRGWTSRRHLRLERGASGWWARDLESKNGLWIDGERVLERRLEPGAELGIGGLTFVAESRAYVGLRAFVQRLLGWSPSALVAVDLALLSIRMAAARRLPLPLCGTGDMIDIAHQLHRRTRGPASPFIASDHRRRDGEESARSVENIEHGMSALAAARGGALCVWSRRLPRDFDDVRLALHDPTTRVQLVVCAESRRHIKPYHVEPIMVPTLASRRQDIGRIIDEYADEAAKDAGAPALSAADRRWLAEQCGDSISEIATGATRLVAIKQHCGNTAAAARAIGMAPISLDRWFRRRLPRPGRSPGALCADVLARVKQGHPKPARDQRIERRQNVARPEAVDPVDADL